MFRLKLEELQPEQRPHFEALFECLTDVQFDLDYANVLLDGSYANADELIAKRRLTGAAKRELRENTTSAGAGVQASDLTPPSSAPNREKICECQLCVENRAFRTKVSALPAEQRPYFEALYDDLDNARSDLNMANVLLDGTWPNADAIIAGKRQRLAAKREEQARVASEVVSPAVGTPVTDTV